VAQNMRCYRHPNRETRISCASCGKPICTECMVQTDVGIKCPDDARLPRGAQAGAMKPNQIAKTLLAGLGVAVVGVGVVSVIFQIGFFSLILSALAGYGAGTLIYRLSGYNGGPLAVGVAAGSVFLAYSPYVLPPLLAGNVPAYPLLAAAAAVILAILASRGQF
jgi:hypothetical protein